MVLLCGFGLNVPLSLVIEGDDKYYGKPFQRGWYW